MAETASDRQRAAALLRKLRAITIEAGASEAEAMTAAAMARRLADQHGLPGSGEPVIEARVFIGRVRTRPIDKLWSAIGRFCHVSAIFCPEARGMEIAYIGRAADVMLAEWLHAVLKRHIDKALAEFKTLAEYRRRKPARRRVAASAFVEAMAQSLRARLDAMADQRIAEPKLAEARQWIANRYGQLADIKIASISDAQVDGARRRGRQAAADVAISTPVAAQPSVVSLLGRG